MYELVLKDARLCLFLLPIWLLFFPISIGISYVLGYNHSIEIVSMIAGLFSVEYLFSDDESWKSGILYASLPYARRSLLLARYIAVWIVFASSFVFINALNLAWTSYLQNGATNEGFPLLLANFSFGLAIVFFCVPFMVHYGSTPGSLLGMFAFAACVALLMLLAAWLEPREAARNLLNSLAHSADMKNIVLTLFAFLMLALLTLVSYRISSRLFEKKDLG
jgi:ABC-type transport system involved in multi-copper enzyme maturation permease subunit